MKRKILSMLLCLIMLLSLAPASAFAGEENGFVSLGHWEQDGKRSNGPESIEWQVLEMKDGKLLLLSRCVLASRPFSESGEDCTWESSDLRVWLNGEFLTEAFTPGQAELFRLRRRGLDKRGIH